MTTWKWVAFGLVFLASINVLIATNAMSKAWKLAELGPRVTRLHARKLLRAGAWMEFAVGLDLVAMGQWSNSIALFGVGFMMLTISNKRIYHNLCTLL